MIKPVLQDSEFLADVEAAREDKSHLHIWWLGQSGFLLQWRGHHLLFDPYLSDSLTLNYADSDKPHVRMTERGVAPERLDFVEVTTSSHNHTDHLDAETLRPLMDSNPGMQLVIAEANREFVAERLGVDLNWPLGLEAGKSVSLGRFTIHGVPAAHNDLKKDALGRNLYLGYVVEAGPWLIYHSGDTLHYEGMEVWLQRWSIDIALLPINGNVPSRGVAGNLDGREAARLAKEIGAQMVIPCHYDMFEFNTVTPELFIRAAEKLDQGYKVLKNGERWSSKGLEGSR